MAVSLEQRASVVGETSFKNRCLMARVMVAVKMLTASDGSYTSDQLQYAHQVLMSPMDHPERVTAAVASDTAIAEAEANTTGSAPDADIEARVEAAWPYLQ